MSAIFELKKQIYSEISDLTYNTFMNNLKNDYFCIVNKKVNEGIDKPKKANTDIDMALNIRDIKLEQSDIKNYFYCINFELYLTVNTKLKEYREVSVYTIIESILKLLSTMEFYYCHKLNNQDIKSIIATQTVDESVVKIEWTTNLYSNNLFN